MNTKFFGMCFALAVLGWGSVAHADYRFVGEMEGFDHFQYDQRTLYLQDITDSIALRATDEIRVYSCTVSSSSFGQYSYAVGDLRRGQTFRINLGGAFVIESITCDGQSLDYNNRNGADLLIYVNQPGPGNPPGGRHVVLPARTSYICINRLSPLLQLRDQIYFWEVNGYRIIGQRPVNYVGQMTALRLDVRNANIYGSCRGAGFDTYSLSWQSRNANQTTYHMSYTVACQYCGDEKLIENQIETD